MEHTDDLQQECEKAGRLTKTSPISAPAAGASRQTFRVDVKKGHMPYSPSYVVILHSQPLLQKNRAHGMHGTSHSY